MPVICVGGWRSLGVMEKILRDTQIEFLSLSRPLVRELETYNVKTGALVIGTYDNSSRNGAYKNMNSIAPKKSTIEKLRIAF